MKCLVVKMLLLVSCCHALPTSHVTAGAVVPAANEIAENTLYDDYSIDLSTLGPDVYGFPKKSTGHLLSTWNETFLMNPEEMGEYAEGDILMPPVVLRNGISDKSRRWNNATIPYRIDGRFKKQHRSIIEEAIADYNLLTCIRFVERKDEKDYIVIKDGSTGCWSRIGRVGGRQEVHLQSPSCVKTKGTVIHELLHVIGFLHEQNRPERDDHVTVLYNNVSAGRRNNFSKATAKQVNDFEVPYDYNSVMHYSEYAFSYDRKSKTIVPKKKGVTIGQRNGLSKGDVLKINRMYNCKIKLPISGWNAAGVFENQETKNTAKSKAA